LALPLIGVVLLATALDLGSAGACEATLFAQDEAEGRVVGVASSVRAEPGTAPSEPAVSLFIRTADGLLTVTIAENARVQRADGSVIAPTDVPPSAQVRAIGRRLGPTLFEATLIEVHEPA